MEISSTEKNVHPFPAHFAQLGPHELYFRVLTLETFPSRRQIFITLFFFLHCDVREGLRQRRNTAD